jgi:prolyl-tRNA editing enzyme YbaK/EbsC (Cys-tRNA(Pro) deacylase)
MSVENVKKYLNQWGMGDRVKETLTSSATVTDAAQTIGVEPARIAKTLSLRSTEQNKSILIVCAGDAKIDNASFKRKFALQARMLSPQETLEITGHSIGGVCPFDINTNLNTIYLDISLKRFDTVFPACGSSNSYLEMTIEELFKTSNAKDWVDVCKNWRNLSE